MEDSTSKLKMVIDLSFGTYMNEGRDLVKTLKQLSRCYAKNRSSKGVNI